MRNTKKTVSKKKPGQALFDRRSQIEHAVKAALSKVFGVNWARGEVQRQCGLEDGPILVSGHIFVQRIGETEKRKPIIISRRIP